MRQTQSLYTVVLGDLIRSRTIKKRRQVSGKIESSLEKINSMFSREMAAPLKLTRGMDEISGLFKRPYATYMACRNVNYSIHPHIFRFIIVRNKIDIGIGTRDPTLMDGAAFHLASDLMKKAKRKKKYFIFNIGSPTSTGRFNEWLTEVGNLVSALTSAWSDHQRSVVMNYEKFKNQERVARKLRITQQAVSDALKRANWELVNEAQRLIDEFLEKLE